MLSLILKILRDKVGELYNSINRKMQPLPFGDDQDYILDSDTVTVSGRILKSIARALL